MKPIEPSGASQAELFRVGPGYVSYWMHEALEHWTISAHEAKAVRELGATLGQLMSRRNEVEDARRRFTPASSLAKRNVQLFTEQQRYLFDKTSGFFLSFYSALSALAGVAVRFQNELSRDLGNPPSRSNAKFLAWLRPASMLATHFAILEEARAFRAILDHKASHQPYEWGTTVDASNGLIHAMVHGPSNRDGRIPPGAFPLDLDDDAEFPAEHTWAFVAPDEDVVLTLLAVQMNTLFPRINAARYRTDTVRCSWTSRLGPHDPDDGYPIFAAIGGTVVSVMPHTPEISEEDQADIQAILAKYAIDPNPDG